MTPEDRPEFAALLAALGEVFAEDITKERAALYFEALADLPVEAVREATRRAIRGCRFFPRPAELRATITAPLNSSDVLQRVTAVLRRSPITIPEDIDPFDAFVIRCLGGPQAVLHMTGERLRFLIDRYAESWTHVAEVRGVPLPEECEARLLGHGRPQLTGEGA